MIIKTRLSEKDFINVNFVLLYQKLWAKLMVGIFGFVLLISVVIFFVQGDFSSIGGLFGPAIFLLIFPLLIYYIAKRNYSSNKRISETIEYRFEDDMLVITGDSFSSRLSWDKLYKVTQTKNWLLIWQSRQLANVIPKRDVPASGILVLKAILNKTGIKNNL